MVVFCDVFLLLVLSILKMMTYYFELSISKVKQFMLWLVHAFTGLATLIGKRFDAIQHLDLGYGLKYCTCSFTYEHCSF